MAGWGLIERTMFGANDLYMVMSSYILNFGIVKAIPVYPFGFLNERLGPEWRICFAVVATDRTP